MDLNAAIARLGGEHSSLLRALLEGEKARATALLGTGNGAGDDLLLRIDDCEAAANALDVMHHAVMHPIGG